MLVTLNEGYGLGNTLLCPCCGGEYLHHESVKVYDRNEDAKQTRVTMVGSTIAVATTDSERSGNPSSRRDGLSIDFWCESCSGYDENKPPAKTMRLHILQHKGNTYLRWEILTQ